MRPAARAGLLASLRALSFQRRAVVLASGQASSIYVDCKQTALHPEGAALLGGALRAGSTGRALPAFIIRETPKGHGTDAHFEGLRNLAPGASVVLLEDVVTTGGSTLRAAAHARAAGLVPLGVVCVVDRDEGGVAALEATGLAVRSLFHVDELEATP